MIWFWIAFPRQFHQHLSTINAVWRYLGVFILVSSRFHSPSAVYHSTVSRIVSLSSFPPTIRKLLLYCATGA